MTDIDDLSLIHQMAFNNYDLLVKSEHAACFHCLAQFGARDASVHTRERVKKDHAGVEHNLSEATAVCPQCGVDAVVCDAMNDLTPHVNVLDDAFLRAMRDCFFANLSRVHESPYVTPADTAAARPGGRYGYLTCDECGRRGVDLAVFNVEVGGSDGNYDGDHRVCERCLRRALHLVERRPAGERAAAVALVEGYGRRLLCVWNKRYDGWSLPGGKVEDGESPAMACVRELHEETGLAADVDRMKLLFRGEHGMKVESTRGSMVYVFKPRVVGELHAAQGQEEGCPITWLSREAFVARSPFGSFYETVFREIGS